MIKDLQVIIFCGGKGIRIREFESYLPKPLIKIGNNAIVEHIINYYIKFGLKKFILCTGYKSGEFLKYFKKRKFRILNNNLVVSKNCEIHIRNTGNQSNTGLRLKKIEKYIKNDFFFLTYGDGICNVNIKSLYNFFLNKKKTIAVTGVNPPSRFGMIEVQNDLVKKFSEKPIKSKNLINGGFFICSKKIFNFISIKKNQNFESDILTKITKKKQLLCYKHRGFWQAMDTRRDYEKLYAVWKKNKFRFK